MKRNKLLRKQPINRRVILATLPCVAGSVYFFGWRSLAMVVLACVVALVAEYIFCKRRNEPVSEAAFVTAILFALILPPTAGWHVIVVGMAVAIIFGKEVFGGFARNIFNPAMAGRCFVYICFPVALTAVWAPNAFDLSGAQWYGAMDRWSTGQVTEAEAAGLKAANEAEKSRLAQAGVDLPARWIVAGDDDAAGRIEAYTGASPLGEMKRKQLEVIDRIEAGAPTERVDQAAAVVRRDQPSIRSLLLGDSAGSVGVTSALMILIGGCYLVLTKTANRTIIISVIVSCYVASEAMYMLGVRPSTDGVRTVLSGGFLFGAFFMATDPISSAKTTTGRIIYGCIIGVGRVVIQNFSVFNGGFMFALLLGNMFAPSIDALVRERKAAKKAKAAQAAAAAEGTA